MQSGSRVQKIGQILSDAESLFLYAMSRGWPGDGRVVELGSFTGGSTCFLAAGLRDRGEGGKVLAVDTFRGSKVHQPGEKQFHPETLREDGVVDLRPFFDRIVEATGVGEWIEPWQETTTSAAGHFSDPIRVLFIDAEHEEESVREDFEVWSKFVGSGACVALHDIGTWPGPTKVCSEIEANREWMKVARCDSIGCYMRVT